MKNWIFDEKVHRIRITSQNRFSAFSQDNTMLKKWFTSVFPEIEKISQKLGLNLGEKWWKIECLMKRCIGSAKHHRTVFRFFARYSDAEEVIHKGISWNWENIWKCWPIFGQKLWKIEYLMNRCIGSAKPHTIVFPIFARYYDAEEVIHKRIFWNWENISTSGPKFGPKMIKNWIFDEKVHRIRKASQNRISIFRKVLRCWRSDS